MEDDVNKEVIEEPPENLPLLPCHVCNRTFLPEPLKKHRRICEQVAHKKRKPFDSLKQRLEGTDLAPFLEKSSIKKTPPEKNNVTPYVKKRQSKWKENHMELVDTIRKAKVHSPKSHHKVSTGHVDLNSSNCFSGASSDKNVQPPQSRKVIHQTTSLTTANERCPSCDRAFGPKAFDRHVEWCKERKCRIQKSPANVQQAKERLDARINYRVPPLRKSKRAVVRDKYSPTPQSKTPLLHRSNTIASVRSNTNLVSKSTVSLSNSQKKHVNRQDKDHVQTRKELIFRPRFDTGIGDIGDAKQVEKSDAKIGKTASTPSTPMYDPIELAQRQLAELLDADDDTTYKPPQLSHFNIGNKDSTEHFRPFTTSNAIPKLVLTTPKNTKNLDTDDVDAEFEPVVNQFDSSADQTDILDREFLLIENLVNNNLLDDTEQLLQNLERLSGVESSASMYSDEISFIDPNLINKHDNLFIPEMLSSEDNSSTSTVDSEITVHDKSFVGSIRGDLLENYDNLDRNNQGNSTKYSTAHLSPSPKFSNVRSAPDGSSADTKSKENFFSFKVNKPGQFCRSKDKLKIDSSASCEGETKTRKLGKNNHKKLPSLDHKKNIPCKTQNDEESVDQDDISEILQGEELFSVDDETYEEYKKYEEMYMREKNGKVSNRKQKSRPEDFGIQLNGKKNEFSKDTTSDRSLVKKHKEGKGGTIEAIRTPVSSNEKLPKYCHECGNKYPVSSAKFCIECGVKRLVL